MRTDIYDVLWLDRTQYVSINDLVVLSGMTEAHVHELVELGALSPVSADEIPWVFRAECVVTARRASRLREDLELDSHAVALALTLLERIRTLEAQLSQLHAQQPSFKRL